LSPTGSSSPPPATDFLWRSIEHLESRVTTVDNKANILLGLVLAVAAAVGALAKEALVPFDDGSAWTWVALTLLITNGVWMVRLVFVALRTLNPRKAAAEGRAAAGKPILDRPQPYVVWPRRGEPWDERPAAHAAALTSPDWQALTDNLAYMQWTVTCLIAAKYDSYRGAIKEFRLFASYQLPVLASLFATLAGR
jgi:hypothetical protein